MHSFVILLFGIAIGLTEGLSLEGARCGQLRCDLHQFCNADDQRCTPCSAICTRENHNYDSALCIKDCQDYLHDIRFLRRDDETQTLRETVEKLQFQVSVITILSSLVLFLLLAFLGVTCCRHGKSHMVKTWNWVKRRILRRKSHAEKYPHDLTHRNPHTESPKPAKRAEVRPKTRVTCAGQDTFNDIPSPRRDLVLEMNTNQPLNPQSLQQNSRSSTQTTSPATENTTITSSRLPAEDSTLDYSYDNIGMNLTPSPDTSASRGVAFVQANNNVPQPNRY